MNTPESNQQEFDCLYQEFYIKKYRTWSEALEIHMMRFVELGAHLAKTKQVKETIIAYKIICQNAAIASIQSVFERLLKVSQEILKSHNIKLINHEDLELAVTPESILLQQFLEQPVKHFRFFFFLLFLL